MARLRHGIADMENQLYLRDVRSIGPWMLIDSEWVAIDFITGEPYLIQDDDFTGKPKNSRINTNTPLAVEYINTTGKILISYKNRLKVWSRKAR